MLPRHVHMEVPPKDTAPTAGRRRRTPDTVRPGSQDRGSAAKLGGSSLRPQHDPVCWVRWECPWVTHVTSERGDGRKRGAPARSCQRHGGRRGQERGGGTEGRGGDGVKSSGDPGLGVGTGEAAPPWSAALAPGTPRVLVGCLRQPPRLRSPVTGPNMPRCSCGAAGVSGAGCPARRRSLPEGAAPHPGRRGQVRGSATPDLLAPPSQETSPWNKCQRSGSLHQV